jgi:magnesium-transporting ATPase (P-type)
MPCDALLLDGECLMNESMLTGESLPVSKTTITNEEMIALDFEQSDPIKTPEMIRYFLFSGTKVIRSRCGKHGLRTITRGGEVEGGPGALAMCVRVGFNTTKGTIFPCLISRIPRAVNPFSQTKQVSILPRFLAIHRSLGYHRVPWIHYFHLQFRFIKDSLGNDCYSCS